MRWYYLPVVLLALTPPAMARPLPEGGVTAQEIEQIMEEKGFTTDVTTDKDGDPLIRSASKDLKFGVFFYGCKGKKRCDSIQFSAGFSLKDVTPAKIAQWNRTKRFGRAYLDNDFEPWVEMDMDLEFGATTEAIANDFDRWAGVISEFNKYIRK